MYRSVTSANQFNQFSLRSDALYKKTRKIYMKKTSRELLMEQHERDNSPTMDLTRSYDTINRMNPMHFSPPELPVSSRTHDLLI